MLNLQQLIPELKLSDNSQLRVLWDAKERSLSLQVWRPAWGKDGHGYRYAGSVTLSGEDLATFVDAIASLQESELRPAA